MISFQEFCTALERTDVEQKMSIRFLNWKQNFKDLFVRTFLSRKRQNQITVNILYTRLKQKKKNLFISFFLSSRFIANIFRVPRMHNYIQNIVLEYFFFRVYYVFLVAGLNFWLAFS
jgi:hypothetical protein